MPQLTRVEASHGETLGPDPGVAFPIPCSGLLATRVHSFNPGGQASGLPRNSTW